MQTLKQEEISKYFEPAETMSIDITEEESLILWNLLEKQFHSCQTEFDHNKITLLFAKIMHKSCEFAGTLEEDETLKKMYWRLIADYS